MLFLARYTMQGRSQAALVVATTGILAALFPLLGCLSGAALALVALQKTSKDVFAVLLACLLAGIVFGFLTEKDSASSLFTLAGLWLPVVVVAYLVQRTNSFALGFLVAMILALLLVLGIYIINPDPVAMWSQAIQTSLNLVSIKQQLSLTDQQLSELVLLLSKLMSGAVAGGFLLNVILSLIIGRWWQAVLYKPGEFQKEFHNLRLGRVVASIVCIITLLALFIQSSILLSMLIVSMVLYTFQGLALLHGLVKKYNLNVAWLVVVYMTVILPQLAMMVAFILAIAGLVDAWVNFRGYPVTSSKD